MSGRPRGFVDDLLGVMLDIVSGALGSVLDIVAGGLRRVFCVVSGVFHVLLEAGIGILRIEPGRDRAKSAGAAQIEDGTEKQCG